jgi:glycosyltransferase involved in cell wall biosynthesis
MSPCDKPIILTFVGNYLPGYKAGGILRTMVNTVENLCDDVEFWIVTRDRDLGDDKPYPDIKLNQWQKVGNAMVYYLPPHSITLRDINNLIVGTPHHVLYLNSYFDPFTVKALLNRKLRRKPYKSVIVAPRGEFAWASLKLKYPKKFVFIQVARIIGLYKNVTWHASSEFEETDIMKVMKINKDVIHNALDLPAKLIPNDSPISSVQLTCDHEGLRLVFLSRISREKNLDYALRILSKVKARVFFDIYGPSEDLKYWKECKELISQLPANIKVKYLGSVNPNQVGQIFSCYDLFLFPSGGENYGHVIAESLTSGTPVLISDKTPWRNLQNDNLGWDISLDQMNSFVEVIEKYALMSIDARLAKRALIKAKIIKHLLDPVVLEANRQLFKRQFIH